MSLTISLQYVQGVVQWHFASLYTQLHHAIESLFKLGSQALGGAKYIFLTHRDDVADHVKWAEALGAQRIMHIDETNPAQKTECAPWHSCSLFP